MKNPRSTVETGAFPVTSNATVVRATDDTLGAFNASPTDTRFYWDRLSNSVQPLLLRFGRIWHE